MDDYPNSGRREIGILDESYAFGCEVVDRFGRGRVDLGYPDDYVQSIVGPQQTPDLGPPTETWALPDDDE